MMGSSSTRVLLSPWSYHSRPLTSSWPIPSRTADCCQTWIAALRAVWVMMTVMKKTLHFSVTICPHATFLQRWWGLTLKNETQKKSRSNGFIKNIKKVFVQQWFIITLSKHTCKVYCLSFICIFDHRCVFCQGRGFTWSLHVCMRFPQFHLRTHIQDNLVSSKNPYYLFMACISTTVRKCHKKSRNNHKFNLLINPVKIISSIAIKQYVGSHQDTKWMTDTC